MPIRSTLVDPLLAPIPGGNPSGRWVRDDAVYEKIKEARREEADVDQGAWQRTRKVADPALVLKLAGDVLATESKDLQLAAWWTEALLRRDGLQGLRDGAALVRGLLEHFWDTLWPAIEDGDASLRAGPLDYFALKLLDAVRAAPLNGARHAFWQYEAAEMAGTSDKAQQSESTAAARSTLQERAQPLIEEVLAAVDATPKAWYHAAVTSVDETIDDLRVIEAIGDERFGDDAPAWGRLVELLSAQQVTLRALLQRRLTQDPDPEGDVAETDGGASALPDAASAGGAATVRGTQASAPTSEGDAMERVVAAARWMRAHNPGDPTPYALLRALRWQPLRASANSDGLPPAALLHAPSTAERSRLKGLMLEQRYEELLEGAEELLGSTVGGAWLDAQRWSLDAAAALGGDYATVHAALQAALRALLSECPRLPWATLLDDSPAANGDTIEWLEREGLVGASRNGSAPPALDGLPPMARRPLLERARTLASSGGLDRAIALLMGELARERSERARFLRRVELLTVMVEAGRADVAMPIVEEMLNQVDEHKLDGWEDGDVLARALVLACRAIDATDGDRRQREQLYLRICRLDPVAALALGA